MSMWRIFTKGNKTQTVNCTSNDINEFNGYNDILRYAESLSEQIKKSKMEIQAANQPEIELAPLHPCSEFTVKILHSGQWYKVLADPEDTPSVILTKLRSLTDISNELWFIKIRLRNEIMYLERLICQYSYIQRCIVHCQIPLLETIKVDIWPTRSINLRLQIQKDENQSEIMKYNEKDHLQLYVNCPLIKKQLLKFALYHGNVAYEMRTVDRRLNGHVRFNTLVCNIPRSACLCISVRKRLLITSKDRQVYHWGRLPLFDCNGHMVSGTFNLRLHSICKGQDKNGFYPFGSSQLDFQECVNLRNNLKIVFPDNYRFYINTPGNDMAHFNVLLETHESRELTNKMCSLFDTNLETLEREIRADASLKLYIWNRRFHAISLMPDKVLTLPAILLCVDWWSRSCVKQAYALLNWWPHRISFTTAILLLTSRFPDIVVRRKAIEVFLAPEQAEGFALMLPQIVHLSKYDVYNNCVLIKLLIYKMLTNYAIAQRIYWLSSSESELLSEFKYEDRFHLISKIVSTYMPADFASEIRRQVEVIKIVTHIDNSLRQFASQGSKKGELTGLLHNMLDDYANDLRYFKNPLRPTIRLGNIIKDECKVFDSNAKPFKLVWRNGLASDEIDDTDVDAKPGFMFKSGDDLNREQLALQMLELFAGCWQNSGMDLPLVCYRTLTTSRDVGLVELIPNAITLLEARRQTERKKINPFTFIADEQTINKWLRKDVDEIRYANSVNHFIRSVAGYSVACDILGIGDRHPSNILILRSGQLIHIDFGYMLGDHVSAGLINRERTPIVLITDFFNVIIESDGEEAFYETCDSAFQIIRDHYHDLYALCLATIDSKITLSLQTVDDMRHIFEESLKLVETKSRARDAFFLRLKKSRDRSILRKIDWEFHAAAHPN